MFVGLTQELSHWHPYPSVESKTDEQKITTLRRNQGRVPFRRSALVRPRPVCLCIRNIQNKWCLHLIPHHCPEKRSNELRESSITCVQRQPLDASETFVSPRERDHRLDH